MAVIVPIASLAVQEISKRTARRNPPNDEEHNNGAIALTDLIPPQLQHAGVHCGQQSTVPEHLTRRNSNSLQNTSATLPDPSNFFIGNDNSDTG
jgi:hypothetical protein